jgi:ferredoxin
VPTLEILASALGPAVTTEATGRLLDACDEAGAPVGFSCRSARCCTCRVEILAGAELLEPPAADEIDVLRLRDSGPQHRLACQTVLLPTPGLVRLRWVGARPTGE